MGFQMLFRSRYDFSIFRIHNNSRLSIVFTIEVRPWLGRTIRTAEETGHGTLPPHPPQCTHWGAFHLSRERPDGRPGVPPLRAERNSGIIRGVPLIRSSVRTGPPDPIPSGLRPSPLDKGSRPQGKAFGRPQGSPLRRNWTGAVGWDSQAQLRNCTSLQFLDSQGPVARLEFRHALRFCAPEFFCPPQGITPVNGVRGKATMSTKCSSGAVPGDPLVSFPSLGKKLAPQGEIPLRTTNAVRNLPPHPAPSGPPSPQGEGLKRGGEIPAKKNTPTSL